MVASEKVGSYAGILVNSRGGHLARAARIATFRSGACVTTITVGVLVAFYALKR